MITVGKEKEPVIVADSKLPRQFPVKKIEIICRLNKILYVCQTKAVNFWWFCEINFTY